MSASRDEIVSFCDELLDVASFSDYCPNGLQVPGAERVETLVTGVSANLDLLSGARVAGAQLILVHHGIFWDAGSRALTPSLAGRLRLLLGAEISLAAYHLPLDAHPEIGNNAIICDRLGLERGERFGSVKGIPIGLTGRFPEPVPAGDLAGRLAAVTGREPLVLEGGPDPVTTVGVVSGGGASMLEEAAALGLDALITGEPNEPAAASARENGITFAAAGHHATETFGVRALGDRVADRFGIEHRFIEIANPV